MIEMHFQVILYICEVFSLHNPLLKFISLMSLEIIIVGL